MYGMIVVGHGAFASGITTSVKMISGELDHYIPLEFRAEEPLETLSQNLHTAIDTLLKDTEGVLIFTDLIGGTPFKTAYTIAHGRQDLAVICGTNLGMLLEANFSRMDEGSLQDLARSIVEGGREQVIYMEKIETTAPQQTEDEESI
jgi:PTS system N-acetylgalactosamine-specific IIA component